MSRGTITNVAASTLAKLGNLARVEAVAIRMSSRPMS
jgi:hypothetical protein